MKKQALLLVVVFLLSLLVVSAAEDGCIYYFHGVDCEECQDTNTFIDDLKSQYPNLQVESYEVYQSRGNSKLLNEYFDSYKVKEDSRGLPVVFVEGSYYIGKESIHNLAEGYIKVNPGKECPSLSLTGSVGVAGEKNPYDVLDTLKFGRVTAAAFSDSFRPAMIALMLILIGFLLSAKKEQKTVERGILFIGAVFAIYFLYAFGLFAGMAKPYISSFFAKSIGIVIIVVSLVTIRSFFKAWGSFVNIIPEKYRILFAKAWKYCLSSWGIFVSAFIFALFSLASMNTIFITLQSIVSESGVRFAALPLTFYYLILQIIPLVVIVAVFDHILDTIEDKSKEKGPHDERKVTLWRKHHHKVLNVAVSALMLVVGIMLLFI